MGCLFAIMAGLFPRLVLFIFWLVEPDRVDEIFTSFIWPFLGIIFLPFATLMYMLLWTPGRGVTGGDWAWVALAGLFDVAHLGASGRDRYAATGRA